MSSPTTITLSFSQPSTNSYRVDDTFFMPYVLAHSITFDVPYMVRLQNVYGLNIKYFVFCDFIRQNFFNNEKKGLLGINSSVGNPINQFQSIANNFIPAMGYLEFKQAFDWTEDEDLLTTDFAVVLEVVPESWVKHGGT